jgi:hypothetical protein
MSIKFCAIRSSKDIDTPFVAEVKARIKERNLRDIVRGVEGV